MNLSLNKHYFWFVTFSLLFKALLEISYVVVIFDFYSYAGFNLNFDTFNYILSWVIFLSCFFFVNDRFSTVSDIFFVSGFLLIITPLCVMYGYDADLDIVPVLASTGAFFLIKLVVFTKLISFRKLPTVKHGLSFALLLSSLFVIFLVIWYFISGVDFNLDLRRVYEFRSENEVLAGGSILSYTNNWTYKIFNLFLLAVALLYSRFIIATIIVLIQVFFYAASAHKGILFSPLIIIGVWFYFKKSNSLIFMPAIFALIIFLTLTTFYLFGDIFLSSFFSRRLFFVPAHLTYTYFDFFNQNEHIIWANSILSPFLQYPYEQSLSNVIGAYLGSPEMGANNGFISSGYAHAGFFGIFFYSMIVGIILRFLNHTTYNYLPIWFAVALCIGPIRSLLSASDLFTVMLTHGFIIALFLIFLTRTKKDAFKI